MKRRYLGNLVGCLLCSTVLPTARRMEKCCVGLTSVVRRFATDIVRPKVREMDENEIMDPSIVKGLFEQGVSHTYVAKQ